MWKTYNTENFVDPREARKKLQADQKTVIDQFGDEILEADWQNQIRSNVMQLAKTQTSWDGNDMWDALGIQDQSLKIKAGRYLRSSLGVEKARNREGYSRYDLSELLG